MIYSSGTQRSATTPIVSPGLAALRSGWRGIYWGARDLAQRFRIWFSAKDNSYRLNNLSVIPIDIHYRHLSRSFWRDV